MYCDACVGTHICARTPKERQQKRECEARAKTRAAANYFLTEIWKQKKEMLPRDVAVQIAKALYAYSFDDPW
jgi:hypothetical protein